MIDQWRRPLDESYRMRQTGVIFECILAFPPRMNVEQAGVSYRTKSVNAQAAGFLAGNRHNGTQHLSDRILTSRDGMKTREYE
jgi:hypothetical protein